VLKRVGILVNLDKSEVAAAADIVAEAAGRHGFELRFEREEGTQLGREEKLLSLEDFPNEIDLLITLGGDGTFLRGARIVGESGTPLLGINLGSLGFMAELPLEKVEAAMLSLAAGDFRLERRRRIQARLLRGEREVFRAEALNDVVVNMGTIPRAMRLDVRIDDQPLGRYLADGIIVATPTGSTAYSLSAGGPIVDPGVESFVLTPICPHTLAVRPLIVQDHQKIELHLGDVSSAVVTSDGQRSEILEADDRIVFNRAHSPVYLLRLPGQSLYRVIQEKLHWGGPRLRNDDLADDAH